MRAALGAAETARTAAGGAAAADRSAPRRASRSSSCSPPPRSGSSASAVSTSRCSRSAWAADGMRRAWRTRRSRSSPASASTTRNASGTRSRRSRPTRRDHQAGVERRCSVRGRWRPPAIFLERAHAVRSASAVRRARQRAVSGERRPDGALRHRRAPVRARRHARSRRARPAWRYRGLRVVRAVATRRRTSRRLWPRPSARSAAELRADRSARRARGHDRSPGASSWCGPIRRSCSDGAHNPQAAAVLAAAIDEAWPDAARRPTCVLGVLRTRTRAGIVDELARVVGRFARDPAGHPARDAGGRIWRRSSANGPGSRWSWRRRCATPSTPSASVGRQRRDRHGEPLHRGAGAGDPRGALTPVEDPPCSR